VFSHSAALSTDVPFPQPQCCAFKTQSGSTGDVIRPGQSTQNSGFGSKAEDIFPGFGLDYGSVKLSIDHSGPFYGIEIRRPDFYLPHLLQKGAHIYYRFRSKFLGERAVQFYFTFQSAPPSFHNSTRAEATLVLFCSKRTRNTSS